MLTLSQTMDGIVKRLQTNKKAYRDVTVYRRSATLLVLKASCIELCPSSLGRLIVSNISSMRYLLKPDRIGYSVEPRIPVRDEEALGLTLDANEILIYCFWEPKRN